jgi:glycosyltransferase involved in cell wall biosynthesis
MEKIDIIIPVFNRPKHTLQTIKSLHENTPNDQFDLYVIDDASDMETKVLLENLQERYNFKLTRYEKNLGQARRRNDIAEQLKATGMRHKYVYQSDNDVYFKPGWLEALVKVYEQVSNKRVALLGASCHPYLQTNEKIFVNTFADGQIKNFTVCTKDAVSGYSHFYSWEIWDRFAPLDTHEGMEKKTGRSEDTKFCFDIVGAGLLVASLEPEMIVPTGKTDSYGDDAVGTETFKNVEGVEVL